MQQIESGSNVLLQFKIHKTQLDQIYNRQLIQDTGPQKLMIASILMILYCTRVISNQMSGSSRDFKRFLILAVKILDSEVEISQ